MAPSIVDDDPKGTISAFLTPFLMGDRTSDGKYHKLLAKFYNRYPIGDVDAESIRSLVANGPDIRMLRANKFMHFIIVENEGMYPFVTMHSSGEWENIRIYVLFSRLDDNEELQSFAMRFESPESGRMESNGLHDFFHAQLCDHISQNVKNICPSWVPCSQPSFPLDAKDDVSLVLCMLISIYGVRDVIQKLNSAGIYGYRRYIGEMVTLSDLT